jgi:RNA polymerase sigma-70 factor (ECF subfamily)
VSYLYSDAPEDRRQGIVGHFEQSTWQAFWLYVVEDRPPDDVAAELEMTVEAVYQAKSRVLRRLRRELDGMME